MDDPSLTGHTVDRQRSVDLELFHQILGRSYQREGARPRIHRPDQPIDLPTILRPIDSAGFPVKLRRVSRLRFFLRDSRRFVRENQFKRRTEGIWTEGCQSIVQ